MSAFAWRSIPALFALLAFAGSSGAQETALRFQHYTMQPGLPGKGMTDMFEDRHGFIWMGGLYGVTRFDGYSFNDFEGRDPQHVGAPQGLIWAFAETRDGAIWIGHTRGLSRVDPTDGHFRTWRHNPADPKSLADDWVSALRVDGSGRLWVGTWNGGLHLLDGEEEGTVLFHYGHKESDPTTLGSKRVQTLHAGSDGILWVGTDAGLDRLDPATGDIERVFRNRDAGPGLNSNFFQKATYPPSGVRDIVEADSASLWLATGDGLVHFDTQTRSIGRFVWPWQTEGGDQSPFWVHSLSSGSGGSLWVGTKNGLRRFSPSAGWTDWYPHVGGPDDSSPVVLSLLEDRGGNLWVGTTGWASRAQPDEGRPAVIPISLSEEARHLSPGLDGRLLVGTLTGLVYRVDGESRRVDPVSIPDAARRLLNDMRVTALAEDDRELLWFGSEDSGIVRVQLDDDTVSIFRHDPDNRASLPSDGIRQIHRGPLGSIWVTTNVGLARWRPEDESFLRYAPDAEEGFVLPARDMSRVVALDGDRLSVEWSGGAARIDARSGHVLELWSPIPESEVYEDPGLLSFKDHVPWFKTRSDRSIRPIGAPWYALTDSARNVLADRDGFQCHVSDSDGVLWIAALGGVARFDPAEGQIAILEEEHDFLGTDFGRGNTCGRDGEGFVYFTRKGGLYQIRPEDFRAPPYKPTVVLTGIQVFADSLRPGLDARLPQKVADTEKIGLAPDENDITFSFVGIDYASPARLHYAVRLDGYEQQWRRIGSKRSARYTNLSPGTYRFLVRAAGTSGLWGPEAQIEVTIASPWWRSPRALIFFVLALGMAVAGTIRWRTRQLQARADALETAVADRTRELAEARTISEEQARRLARLNRTRNNFFANISHEFRTPLTLVLGPLQDALDGGSDGRPRRAEVPMMHRNARRLLQLINQLLDLSKLESGQLHLHPKRVELVAFLRGLVGALESRATRKDITLNLACGATRIETWMDPDKLEKIVTNLLSNALKFTPAGGSVHVELSELSDRRARLIVSDTGSGIEPADQSHIFDRFYQADSTSNQAYEGTGIGLALVKELVELHNGRISVESEPGEGARFTVEFPLESVPAQESQDSQDPTSSASIEVTSGGPEPPLADSGESQARILVVDDNEDMRTYVRSHLENHFEVQVASDGVAGLEHAREWPPDLVITDVMMPRMDGFEFARSLRDDPDLGHIPVILLTARTDPEGRLEGLDTGADDYLQKPFSAPELLARVRNLLAVRTTLRDRFRREVIVKPANIVITPEDEVFLSQVLVTIEEHLHDSAFAIDWLADEVGVSRRVLERRIEASTGESPAALVRRLRIERARDLLGARAASVAEIAYMVGFRSRSHFSRAFHRETGIAPTEVPKSEDPTG